MNDGDSWLLLPLLEPPKRFAGPGVSKHFPGKATCEYFSSGGATCVCFSASPRGSRLCVLQLFFASGSPLPPWTGEVPRGGLLYPLSFEDRVLPSLALFICRSIYTHTHAPKKKKNERKRRNQTKAEEKRKEKSHNLRPTDVCAGVIKSTLIHQSYFKELKRLRQQPTSCKFQQQQQQQQQKQQVKLLAIYGKKQRGS